MTKEQLAEYIKMLRNRSAFVATVVRGFKARWVNPVMNAEGRLFDIVREVTYSEGERLYINCYRPESCNIQCEGKPTMVVSWEELEKGELNLVEIV